MIRLWCAGVFNWMRHNACMSLSGSTDGCQWLWMGATDCIFAAVKMKEAAPSLSICERALWSLCGPVAQGSKTSNRSLPAAPPYIPPPPEAHTFSTYTLLLSPLPAVSLCSFWVMGTDGWQLLAVSLGSSNLPLPLSPPPLVSCNWWLGCRDSHGIAMRPLSLSRSLPLQAEGLWGERGGRQCETAGAVREGGLLLTEEKCL